MSVEALEKEIAHHNELYFEKNKPEISDYDFDRLVERLKSLKPDSAILTDIPADYSVKDFKKVSHRSPMLSLNKCYDEEDLNDWASKFEGEVLVTPKIDGLATELCYDAHGNFILGATRGDGFVGEDISANIKMIEDIPQKIKLMNQRQRPVEGEGATRAPVISIRGEIYMKLSVFQKHKETFANPRNLAAGAVKQKDPKKTKDYRLSFLGYDILGMPFEKEADKFKWLHSFKVPTVEMKLCKKETMQEAYEYFLAKRDSHDYETDGVVFKANSMAEQERLGFTAHHPRYSIAYKFQGDSSATFLKDVEWSVARTRVITPVGVVEPVELSGATVTHVSLHNVGLMQKLGLRKGAKVLMMRRGGVIPNLESVLEPGKGEEFKIPLKCPSCGAPTQVRDDFLYCTNQEACRRAKMQELEHFIKVIECDGFGEKLIEKLYDNGFVQAPADFYSLRVEDLLELERMGEVLAQKLIGNIQSKKKLPLDVFLRALGIRELAKHSSKILVKEFGTLKKIFSLKEEDLASIHTIGPVIAREVVEGLRKKKTLIEKLLKHVKLSHPPLTKEGGGGALSLTGKSFVFTGTLAAMDRREAEKKVEALGAEIASGVTKELTYLVIGSEGYKNRQKGNKWIKAEQLISKGASLKIISEEEFLKML